MPQKDRSRCQTEPMQSRIARTHTAHKETGPATVHIHREALWGRMLPQTPIHIQYSMAHPRCQDCFSVSPSNFSYLYNLHKISRGFYHFCPCFAPICAGRPAPDALRRMPFCALSGTRPEAPPKTLCPADGKRPVARKSLSKHSCRRKTLPAPLPTKNAPWRGNLSQNTPAEKLFPPPCRRKTPCGEGTSLNPCRRKTPRGKEISLKTLLPTKNALWRGSDGQRA